MAGVTDKPFRLLCKRLGAGMAVSEMTSSDPRFWRTAKSLHRMDHVGEPDPVSVQIAGTVPAVMAAAARHNVEHGAQLIDNSGVPVTAKIRTGWDASHRNAAEIARIAEDAGIAALTVHGRTRDQQYAGSAEYDTIARIKSILRIPVIANGDIDSPRKAKQVLDATGCDAVMVGRAAQGRPWILGQIGHYLATGELVPEPSLRQVRDILLGHLGHLHAFYGEATGVRIARKHLGWYAKDRPENAAFRSVVNSAQTADEQLRLTRDYFDALAAGVATGLPAAA